jgi:DNA-binding NtrC family response regulator
MVRRIDVLLVKDDERACREIAQHLGSRFGVRVATGLRDAITELVRRVPDAVVCSLELPPFRGDAFLSMVAEEHPQVWRVLMAGSEPLSDCIDIAHVTLPPGAGIAELRAALGGED